MLALFEHHPRLKDRLPHVPLGEFPTPVEKLERLGQAIGAPGLYVKREDLSSPLYGWWNSYSSRDFSAQIAAADHRRLPKYFWRYF